MSLNFKNKISAKKIPVMTALLFYTVFSLSTLPHAFADVAKSAENLNREAELKAFLNKELDADKFLESVLSANIESNLERLENQKELVKLAIQKGAKIDKLPLIKDELAASLMFTSRHQNPLRDNLNMVLKRIDNGVLAEKISHRGHCHGFTTLWLYSKWLEFRQSHEKGTCRHQRHLCKYDKDWFKRITKYIGMLNEKNQVDFIKMIPSFEEFATKIDLFQSPKDFIENMTIADSTVHKIKNNLTADRKILTERYKIASSFASAEQLALLLEKVVINDVLVYVKIPMGHGYPPGHSTGLFKHGNNYYWYDPNDGLGVGEHKYSSAKEVAEAIFKNWGNDNHAYGLIICAFDKSHHIYPKQEDVLKMIHTNPINNDNNFLEDSAEAAIYVRSLESLQFFLNNGLDPAHEYKTGWSLLGHAVATNSPDIVTMLLEQPSVNPKQSLPNERDKDTRGVNGFTYLHLAAKKGYFDVVRILLKDGRIPIDQKDSNDKTALDYALKEKHETTIQVLLTNP